MEKILNLIFNAENVRMLVILAFVCSGYVLINSKIDSKIDDLRYNDLATINKRIDGVEASIKELRAELKGEINELRGDMKELKYNDFAHLSGAFEALTYVLEKNGSLKRGDKAYVDSRLAH
ncbi:MAG: hypothetical protein LBC64_06135 [Fibromonadaceae bacterium]|jgi:hypothetical protein|nr:hypothetical protein [Fibromonadaceae bacterium]